jgi:hypothetical protein
MLDFEDVIAAVVDRSPLRLIAIDGLPLAGKSTLADVSFPRWEGTASAWMIL